MYRLIRSILFLFEPEKAHHISMNTLSVVIKIPIVKSIIQKLFTPKTNFKKIGGLKFRNIIGLGAGFDKNAKYLHELDSLGFGFVEIGTVTPLPQGGNEKPRLFRLKKDKALINRMGFNNAGVKQVKSNIIKWRNKYPESDLVVGGNIGKNKLTSNEDAWKDYVICFKALYDVVDYFVVNVSSPNTPGLRELQEKESLKKIITCLQQEREKFSDKKHIFLKVAPDLSLQQTDDIIDLSHEVKLDGLIIANTTISRAGLLTDKSILDSIGNGGLSGNPLNKISEDMLEYISSKISREVILISSGGIFTAEDVRSRIKNGASLVQIWTSFIYEGPGILRKIS